jgi:hypothetical protein
MISPPHGSVETREHVVQGMASVHRVMSLHEQVPEVLGVSAADVDRAFGRRTVSDDVDDGAIRAAVQETRHEGPRVIAPRRPAPTRRVMGVA